MDLNTVRVNGPKNPMIFGSTLGYLIATPWDIVAVGSVKSTTLTLSSEIVSGLIPKSASFN